MSALTRSSAWQALVAHAAGFHHSIESLFAVDAQRAEHFALDAAGLHLDYSKQRISCETLPLLLELARSRELPQWIARLFAGEAVNNTENRAAAHMALRVPSGQEFRVQGQDVVPEIQAVLSRMETFCRSVRSGEWLGYSGLPITDVVNIGIGGSDLGPRMVCEALQAEADGPLVHFVSNVDGAQIGSVLARLQPATTLFVVTSKTFTTQETMTNAQAARRWLSAQAPAAAVARHFVAVSSNLTETARFGIPQAQTFGFWDWVGGRYSLWSAVGLSIMLALGGSRFRELLAGAHEMDEHFRQSPLHANMPVIMGLIGVWNTNFLACNSQNIAVYAQRLVHFSAWLQQLEMESNGKGVDREGQPVDYATTPALWGDVGTNGQHAFFQMLHQGPTLHATDFILPVQPGHAFAEHNELLIANCLAQSAALMQGKSADVVRAELLARGMQGQALEAAIPHRVFSGNRPSNTLLLTRLDARHLGALLALYEHRTYVQSVLWNLNPFDQWGVELGKQLAQRLLSGGENPQGFDASTQSLLRRIRGLLHPSKM